MSNQRQIVINDELTQEILELCARAGNAYMKAVAAAANWMGKQNEAYERAAVKRACSRRRDWKVSDVANLRALPGARISRQRLEALEGSKRRGRPVVSRYRSLPEALSIGSQLIKELFDADTPPHKRLRALGRTRWLPHFAEALYRGCYAQAKAEHLRSPSVEAERMAASSMGISEAKFRKLCQQVRKQRKAEQSEAMSAISLKAFDEWKRTGKGLPE